MRQHRLSLLALASIALCADQHYIFRSSQRPKEPILPSKDNDLQPAKPMRSAQGYKLKRVRDYSSRPSLLEQLRALKSWNQSVQFLLEVEKMPGVSDGTLRKLTRDVEARASQLKAFDQNEERRREFYAQGQLPNQSSL